MELAFYWAGVLVVAVLVLVRPYIGLLALSFMLPLEESFLGVQQRGVTVTRYLGLFVITAWAFSKIRVRRMPYYETSMQWGILLLCWAGLSTVWSVYRDVSVSSLTTLVQLGGLAMLTADLASSPRRVAGLLGTFLAGCLALSLLGLFVPSLRAGGPLMTLENTGAKWFSFCAGAVVLAGLVLLGSRGIPRWLSRTAIAAVGGNVLAVVLAGERGTFVALALTLVVLGLIEGGRMRAVCLFAATVTVVGITSSFLAERAGLPSDIAGRYRVEEMARTGGTGRTRIWGNALALFMRSPLVGSGLSTFHEPDPYRDPRFMSAHNDLLGIAVDLGVVGALLYLAVMGSAIVRPLRVRSKMSLSQSRVLPLVVSALMMYLAGSGLTSRFFYAKAFWLLLGLSYAVTRVPGSATEHGSAAVSSEPPTPRSAHSSSEEWRQ
jgi:hypothetical protein